MELLCRIDKGLKPNILDKLLGLREPEEMIQTVSFWLTEPTSKKLLPLKVSARVFGMIIHRLSEGHTIRFLFPYDVGQVKNRLSDLRVAAKKESGWLWLEITPLELPKLMQVLEAASFTTFYAQVNGEKVIPPKPTGLFDALKQTYFLVVFTLYDDSIEILSSVVPPDVIINCAREVGIKEGVQVV
jgi:hypothetical protein